MAVTVVADHGTHLLVARGDRYAVIEQRDNEFYNCHDQSRRPVKDRNDVGEILDEADWMDHDAARAMFDDVTRRGDDLARRML